MINFFLAYLFFGTIWLASMEYYTTTYKIGPRWSNRERVTQLIIWPLALTIFLTELYKNLK